MLQTSLTIVVSGMIAADPHQGGATWAVLQYVLGLRDLGHRVFLIEPIPAQKFAPSGVSPDASPSGQYFRRVVGDFGLNDSAALLVCNSQTTVGLPYHQCEAITREADLLINISGMLRDKNLITSIPCRVYLDLDPAFIQCWHAQGIDMHLDGHTHFVTIGRAIGEPDCPVPTCGRSWLKTLQPVVLSYWPVATRITHDALTTIGNWRGYGSVNHCGVLYGQKAHSLRQLFELPTLTPERFLLAMAIDPGEIADLQQLDRFGWQRTNPALIAATPQDYQQFIQGSKAELGIAKSGYVASRSGWFSDRSACYLACGRPVIAQDTGFPRYLPIGEGLFAFRTTDDVLSAIESLNTNYRGHCRAARELAQTYFDSRKVLPRFLDLVSTSP